MRVAVVGSGIAGLAAAYWLAPIHDVSVFEAEDRIGGHAHSVTVRDGGDAFPVDTGFLVFNDRTYPILTALFDRLGVRGRLSDMSFSVRDERDRLEYGGGSWNALFAQRTNLVRPSFHALLREILRFHRFARGFLQEERADVPLAEFLRAGSFSDRLRRCYLVPMTAAIWSAAPASVAAFPTTALLRFFEQHGLLETGNYPRWFTVEGASRAYLDALTRGFRERIRLAAPVRAVRRAADHVEIATDAGGRERFDHVVLALHSDQAIALLEDPSEAEREILTAIPYLENEAVLHTDATLLPRRRRAWSSWNYLVPREEGDRPLVTYHLNRLHRLPRLRNRAEFCVTLNPGNRVAADRVLGRYRYAHPAYSARAEAAQRRHAEISGVRRTHYAGAYWGYGFHEDGVRSAALVARALGATP